MYNLIPFLFFIFLLNQYQVSHIPKYVALGDSLAVGFGAFWGCSYAKLYYRWLLECGKFGNLCYCNLGVLGWTSAELRSAIQCNYRYRKAIEEACIITLDIGGNDILRHKYCPDQLQGALACFKENLHAILHEIRCLNNQAQIYVMDLYNPYPCGHPMHKVAEAWVTAFNDVIWSTLMVPQYRLSGIANVYASFKGNELTYTLSGYDNVHPSTAGYRAIFDCFKGICRLP